MITMHWFKLLMIATYILAPILELTMLGKPREPKTGGDVVYSVVIGGLMIWGILSFWK